MYTVRNCSENTTAKYMQFFKQITIVAMKYGWIHKNPFADYNIRIKKVDRGYLTQDEVETLIRHKFKIKRLERVRDVFVFCCFTGLSHIDVRNLTAENIRTSFDGKPWIMGKRGKTEVGYQVPLLEIPQMIIDKYRKCKFPKARLLPVSNNQNTNFYLKEVGEEMQVFQNTAFDIETLVEYENGGEVRRYKSVETSFGDYNKIYACCDWFALQGKKVLMTPRFNSPLKNPDYQTIYASLKGTQYWGKCPDFSVDGVWYEHEGYDDTKNLNNRQKRADTFCTMMKRGVKQCDRLILEECHVGHFYAKRTIYNRIHFEKQNINEVYIRTDAGLELLYKKQED
jgi:hypothetical protein